MTDPEKLAALVEACRTAKDILTVTYGMGVADDDRITRAGDLLTRAIVDATKSETKQ